MMLDLFSGLLSCLPPYMLMLFISVRRSGKLLAPARAYALLAFYVAVIAMLAVTGITVTGGFRPQQYARGVNLMPLKNIRDMLTSPTDGSFINIAGNILLFMPFGFLLPLLWRRYGPARTIISGALFSLAIECAQFFLMRSPDIDDILLNTLGAAFGYGAFSAFQRVMPAFTARVRDCPRDKLPPWAYIGLAAACMLAGRMIYSTIMRR